MSVSFFCLSHILFLLKSYDNEVISLQNSSCVSSALLFFLLFHQKLEEGGDSLSESANQTVPHPTISLGDLSALDITNDEDLPTDPSNSSDTQEESECKQTVTNLSYFFPASYLVFPHLKNTWCSLQIFSSTW